MDMQRNDLSRGGRPAAGSRGMQVALFAHSLVSDWHHGAAHFLRGVLSELAARGHSVRGFEPSDGWSRANLLADHGPGALARFSADFPELPITTYLPGFDPAEAVASADLVLVNEWTDPALVARLGRLRANGAGFILLFHDSSHRAVTDPDSLRATDLSGYDGVLAFGATLAEIYRRWGWGERVYVWHEAADTRLFRPPDPEIAREGVAWVGDWGDAARDANRVDASHAAGLEQFVLAPAQQAGLALDVYGVRYPEVARALLASYGARYRGWLANARVPACFARHAMTVHVPARPFVRALSGIPTIRTFEALACGIPLVSAPWSDLEGLFRPGQDLLFAQDGAAMRTHLAALAADPAMRASLAAHGLATIRARHTCAHRVDDLLRIVARLTLADARPAKHNVADVGRA